MFLIFALGSCFQLVRSGINVSTLPSSSVGRPVHHSRMSSAMQHLEQMHTCTMIFPCKQLIYFAYVVSICMNNDAHACTPVHPICQIVVKAQASTVVYTIIVHGDWLSYISVWQQECALQIVLIVTKNNTMSSPPCTFTYSLWECQT